MNDQKISELLDDELEESLQGKALAALKTEDARLTWEIYHQIGDELRGEPRLSNNFQKNLWEQLEQEPSLLSPSSKKFTSTRSNQYLYPIAASLAAIGFVGWIGLFHFQGQEPTNLIAQSETSTGPVANTNKATNSTSMDEYLAAHQEYAPTTAIQGATPYVRMVVSSSTENR